MARKRRSTVTTRKAGNSEIVIVEQPAAAAPLAKTRKRGRVRRALTAHRATKKNTIIGAGLGGLAYGFVEKTFGESIPRLPVLGKSGTIALAVYMFGGNNQIVNDIGIAAAVIAGYSLAKDGVISGYDDDHGLASDV